MSLLDEWTEPFVKLNKVTATDTYGGYETVWVDGDSFKAAAIYSPATEDRVAAVQGVVSDYTITTSRSVLLNFHDVVKRVSDGKIFRVTSDSKDKRTPMSTPLDMRQVYAEVYELPR